MLHFLASLLCLAGFTEASEPVSGQAGYLCRVTDTGQVEAEPFIPREGDMIVYTYCSFLQRMLYKAAGSGPPYHSGMVVRLPDGKLATLEAGGADDYCIYLLTLPERLPAYKGRVWVRRIKQPLNPEESAHLTDFATSQTEKRFAFGRLFLGTIFLRRHCEWSRELFGKTTLHRRAWFCSELVVTAGVAAGRLDPKTIPANAIYPRDLFLDEPFDLGDIWERPVFWSEQPLTGTVEDIIKQTGMDIDEQAVFRGMK